MQANNSSQIHEEFELSSRNVGTAQQRDGSEADVVHEEHDDSDKSITPSPSGRIDRRPLHAHANEQDTKAILLRKHVPLIVLPDFDQNARDCGHTQDTQEPGRTMSPDRNGGHRETRSDDGHDALGELRDERTHRAPSPWVATFFDLIFVAILGTFSTTHELTNAAALLRFFTFFVLLWWSWLAQVTYDIRFETDDLLHRLFKLLQLCGLAYLGAAAGGWNIKHLTTPSNIFAENVGDNYTAHNSLVTVMSAYIFLRFLLAIQYAVLLFLSRHERRHRRDLVLPIVTNCISAGFFLAGVLINSNSVRLVSLKLSLLYIGVLIEVGGGLLTFLHGSFLRFNSEKAMERIGNLTLIIIGEGFIGILNKFNKTLLSFSRNNIGTYINAGCAITILFFLFEFGFTGFNPDSRHGRRRTTLWTLLQFPTHFCLLMYFAAIGNVNVASGVIAGIAYAQDAFLEPALGLTPGLNDTARVQEYFLQDRSLAAQLATLNLFPTWREEIALLANASSNRIDVEIEAYKYFGDIIMTSAVQQYDIDIDEEAFFKSLELGSISSAAGAGTDNADRALLLLLEIVGDLATDLFAGTFWLFPTAGGSLILLACADIARYNELRNRFWCAVYAIPILFGIALGLLGLLNAGQRRINLTATDVSDESSPLYQVLITNWSLPICTLTYATVWLLTKVR
ncbi:hypothetical protein NCC49_002611 [Naganishia albida]|nr:hypothetical protein NCC49_002611 [Naganishia albida]